MNLIQLHPAGWGFCGQGRGPTITAEIPQHAAGANVLPLSWEKLVTDPEHIKAFRASYLEAFQRGETLDFALR